MYLLGVKLNEIGVHRLVFGASLGHGGGGAARGRGLWGLGVGQSEGHLH